MLVLNLTNYPVSLRGDLTKWLLEINTGVFVGNISARVREQLWGRVCGSVKNGQAIMVYAAKNEQRLSFQTHNCVWEPIDFDGLKLMLRPSSARTKHLQMLRQPKTGWSKASQYRLIKRLHR